MPIHDLRVVALCGSLRPGSHTRQALRIALEGAAAAGADTHLIDLRDYNLVFVTGEDDQPEPEDVARLREEVKEAHGVLVGTPEYHGSYSGVLKNALDLMGFEEFEGKMIGLVGVAGGGMGALNALNHLRTVGRSLHAWVHPEQVSIPRAWDAFDENGRLKDPKLEARVRSVGQEVARFAYLHHNRRNQEFLEQWERATPNPGGKNR